MEATELPEMQTPVYTFVDTEHKLLEYLQRNSSDKHLTVFRLAREFLMPRPDVARGLQSLKDQGMVIEEPAKDFNGPTFCLNRNHVCRGSFLLNETPRDDNGVSARKIAAFRCEEEGCPFIAATDKGLRIHKSRMHSLAPIEVQDLKRARTSASEAVNEKIRVMVTDQKSNAEIMAELRMTKNAVESRIRKMRKLGEMPPAPDAKMRPSARKLSPLNLNEPVAEDVSPNNFRGGSQKIGRPKGQSQESKELDIRIMAMYPEISIPEIANRLNEDYNAIRGRVNRLRRLGKITEYFEPAKHHVTAGSTNGITNGVTVSYPPNTEKPAVHQITPDGPTGTIKIDLPNGMALHVPITPITIEIAVQFLEMLISGDKQ